MGTSDESPLESRPPTLEDLVELCRQLNDKGVHYIVVGGMAVIQHGFVRATEDIDLLLEATPENEKKLKEALLYLPDQAIKEVEIGDLAK
ncbi:MAG: nucleotidyltransferase, partial [Deltaproteobacteria bacterium]|nr:nucleotidyltransferase [Deltaproteobacteria bacterium]